MRSIITAKQSSALEQSATFTIKEHMRDFLPVYTVSVVRNDGIVLANLPGEFFTMEDANTAITVLSNFLHIAHYIAPENN